MERRVAYVTGASSGIGRAIAVALGELGWGVAIGARRVDRLDETAELVRGAGGEPFVQQLDVADTTSVERFVDTVQRDFAPADVLVNNAGVSYPGEHHRRGSDDVKHEVDTNLLGPLVLSKLVVDSLIGRRCGGDLIFMTSDASTHPRPRMATYTATKAGLEAFARALSMELEGTGIRSTTIRVGPTLSDFGTGWDPDQIGELLEYWPKFGLQRHFGLMQPEDVARAVVLAVTTPPGVHLDTIEVQPQAPVDP